MKQGSLLPNGYIPRIVDDQISRQLDLFGAIEIAGTMWCGKTWSSLSFAESITSVGRNDIRMAVEADPTIALLGKTPHVIDEWQDVPAIWDEVRMDVDQNGGEAGRFILTGSSDPHKNKVRHSGAGRIDRIRMSTMTLQETGESSGVISLQGLFDGEFQPVLVQQNLFPLAEMVCRGGWPMLISKRIKAFDAQEYLRSYFDALFDISIPRRGLNSREAAVIAQALARNISQSVTFQTLTSDAGFREIDSKRAVEKTAAYVDTLSALYVIQSVTGWDAPIRSKSRLRVKPKYYFADPSMAAFLLGTDPERLVMDGQTFGLLFESLCMHDLAVYASAMKNASSSPLYYYRDSDGLEVDAVIELRDGRWGAFEIKLGESKITDAAANLHRLERKVSLNPDARNPKPSFLAVLVGAGETARYDKANDVYVIPITALGK